MDPIAADKRTAMLRYSRLHKITALLRCVELAAAAAALLWSSSQLPAAARYSGDLLRRLLPVLLGPRFLFLLGNAIVLTLLLNSRRSHLTSDPGSDIGDEISASFAPPPPLPAIDPPSEVVFEDKKVCIEERAPNPPAAAPARERACRRSRSERMGERQPRKGSPELRRAETDVGKVKGKGKGEEGEDEEEFRRTIEAFIEKQWKFQREESMAIVCADDVTLTCSNGTPEPKEIGLAI